MTTPIERLWAKGRNLRTVIDLPGGRLVVPGTPRSNTNASLAQLVACAIRAGTARIKPAKRK